MEHDFIVRTSDNQITDDNDFHGPLTRYLKTIAGKQQLAAAMAAPLRRRIDYQNLARKIFSIQPLPAPPSYFIYGDSDD